MKIKKIENLDLILDAEPVKDENGETVSKLQHEWVEYWRMSGKDFASMPDYYKVFRNNMYALGHEDDFIVKGARLVRESMGFPVGVTSTGVGFESRNNLEGEVIHNYSSRRQRSMGKVLVPPHFSINKSGSVSICQGIWEIYDRIRRGETLGLDMDQHTWLKELMRSSSREPLEVKAEDCLHFLQKLFDTTDDLETISAVLYSAFDYSDKGFTTNIYINTDVPTHEGMRRSCGFKTQINLAEKVLNVEIGVLPEGKNYGCSRGVEYKGESHKKGVLPYLRDGASYLVNKAKNVIPLSAGVLTTTGIPGATYLLLETFVGRGYYIHHWGHHLNDSLYAAVMIPVIFASFLAGLTVHELTTILNIALDVKTLQTTETFKYDF